MVIYRLVAIRNLKEFPVKTLKQAKAHALTRIQINNALADIAYKVVKKLNAKNHGIRPDQLITVMSADRAGNGLSLVMSFTEDELQTATQDLQFQVDGLVSDTYEFTLGKHRDYEDVICEWITIGELALLGWFKSKNATFSHFNQQFDVEALGVFLKTMDWKLRSHLVMRLYSATAKKISSDNIRVWFTLPQTDKDQRIQITVRT